MKDDKYDCITRLIKQTGQLIVELEQDELHTHQKIERLKAVVAELVDFRNQCEREQTELFWETPTKEKPELTIIDSDAA